MTNKGLRLYMPATYRISVQGRLDQSWSDRLGGVTIGTTRQDDAAPVTTLTGQFVDRAVLLGVLNTLYNNYHCPLLAVDLLGGA